jgi:hypothetical protein
MCTTGGYRGRVQAAQIAAEPQELGPEIGLVLRRLHVLVETVTVHVQRPEQAPDSLGALVGGPLPTLPDAAPSTCAIGSCPQPAKAGITVDPGINTQPTTTSKARDQPRVSSPLRSSAARSWLSHSVPSWRPFGNWSPRSQRHVVIIASTMIRHSRSKS